MQSNPTFKRWKYNVTGVLKMERLKNKVAIITGGASGMGAAMAQLFSDEGAIVIAADINTTNFKTIEEIHNVHAMKLDVSSDESWKEVANKTLSEYGRIDILINNAGISSQKSSADITEQDWTLMHKINAFGPFLGMRNIAEKMKLENKGAIVNISSYTAIIGSGFNQYSASKGSVRAISRAAAIEFASSHIRVNTIFPGTIETPMTANLGQYKEAMEQLVNATPLKRLGTASEVANAALFLASDEASYITGAELVIDGGYSAQ